MKQQWARWGDGQTLIRERGSGSSWELLLGEEAKVSSKWGGYCWRREKGPETEKERDHFSSLCGHAGEGELGSDWRVSLWLAGLSLENPRSFQVHRALQPQLIPVHSEPSHIFFLHSSQLKRTSMWPNSSTTISAEQDLNFRLASNKLDFFKVSSLVVYLLSAIFLPLILPQFEISAKFLQVRVLT